MGVIVLGLLVLLQLLGVFASGFEFQPISCNGDQIAYWKVFGHDIFYLNGNIVEKFSFCKALQFHYANGCIHDDYPGNKCCPFGVPTTEFPSRERRKLMQKGAVDDDLPPTVYPNEENDDEQSFSTLKNAGMLASGSFVVCCAFLCPCFYKRRKATAHTVLGKDQHSTDSLDVNVSSFELNPLPEKFLGSPSRVPPSPSWFSTSPKLSRLGSVHLNLSQVTRATRNFSTSMQIGEGGFGTVYKALLEDGNVVAVKRAKKEHVDNLRTEFSNEIDLLTKIDHRNLVKLLGYVDKGSEWLIITEYVPNGTLREHLDGQHGKILDFSQRIEIAMDVAHALTYLHLYTEKQIIHRDVKSSNILLTESIRAKVADFGFARHGTDSEHTHISTKVKGTVGYLDPEYLKTYKLTPKSDVYSFGVLLLEILTGRRPVEPKRPPDERITIRWAFQKYSEGSEGSVAGLMDPLIAENVNSEVLMRIFGLAFQAAAPVRVDRPDMKQVGELLWVIRSDYHKSLRRM